MKKTMKLTYLLTLLLLLFSFTACGSKEDSSNDKDDTKVEDNKDKDEDTQDADSEEDTQENTEDADSKDDTEEADSDNDETASTANATIADVSYTVSESWTLESSDATGATYLLPSAEGNPINNFMIMVSDAGEEISDEDLVSAKDTFTQQYESMDATVVEESTTDMACGTALVFKVDGTKMLEAQGLSGYTAYIKQVIFVNGTKTYIFQLTSLGSDFDTLEPEFDAVISSISK